MKKFIIILLIALVLIAGSVTLFMVMTNNGPIDTNEPILFEVTLPTGNAYQIVPVSPDNLVGRGEGYNFRININSDYIGDYMVVKVDGIEIIPVDGIYTIDNITENKNITIEGMVYKAPSSEFLFNDHIVDDIIIGKTIVSNNITRPAIILPDSVDGIPVTGISDNAFLNNTTIVSLIIPENIISIGSYSFFGMTRLEKVIIADSVTSIGTYAFSQSALLENIVYNETSELSSIGAYAFQKCDSLTDVNLPASVASIGDSAYSYCGGLTNIIIDNAATFSTKYLFSNCLNLISATIKSNIAGVAYGIFDGCTALNNVTIEQGVINIGDFSFNNCAALANITFPDSVTAIGNNAFYGCSNLAAADLNEGIVTIGNYAFNKCASLSGIEIPSSVTEINNMAFALCDNLASVVFNSPSSLIIIGTAAFAGKYSDSGVLSGNGNLISSLTLPDSLTYIGEYAFAYCDSLSSAVISGNIGETGNYSFYECNSLTTLLINNGTATLGDYAFAGCDLLNDVTLPDSIITIGARAFNNCIGLISINIPGAVAEIGEYAFAGSTNLDTVIFNSGSDLSIGNYAFNNCTNLEHSILPSSLKTLGNYAFAGSGVITIIIPSGLSIVGNYAFANCLNLASVTFQEGVTTIGNYAFENSDLITVNFASSITEIGTRAFRGTWWLNNSIDARYIFKINDDSNDVYIIVNNILIHHRGNKAVIVVPDNVIKISSYAFELKINITSIELPVSLLNIGSYAFTGCNKLTNVIMNSLLPPEIGTYVFQNVPLGSIIVEDSATEDYTTNNTLANWTAPIKLKVYSNALTVSNGFITNGGMLVGYNGLEAIVEIPWGITTIGENAFNGNITITSVIINNSTTYISNYAFYECNKLVNVNIPDSVTGIGNYAFALCDKLQNIIMTENSSLNSIGNYAFAGRHPDGEDITGNGNKIASFIINSAVLAIGEGAFMESNLGEIIIPDNVTSLGSKTFSKCLLLTEATLGNGISIISGNLFDGCINLQSINIPLINEISDYAFNDCSSLLNITIPGSVETIGQYAFNNCIEFTSIIIPDSVTVIENNSFSGCTNLNSVTLPANLSYIADYSFNNCSELLSVVIPQTVNQIGDYAFNNCSMITTVNIPDSVLSIGDYAYYNCTAISSLTIGNTVNSIGGYSFYNCDLILLIDIPDSVTEISDYAFYSCSGLSSVNISENSNLSAIGNYAFHGAVQLTGIFIPDKTASIGDYAFAICTKLETLTFEAGSILTSIGDYAFAGEYYIEEIKYGSGNKLSSVIIPDSVISIGDYSFYALNQLTALSLGTSVYSIGDYAFSNCAELTNFTFPANLYFIGIEAFSGCSSLTSLNINADTISEKAFYQCSNVNAITINIGVENIGELAFGDLESLTNISVNPSNSNYTNKSSDGVLYNKSKTILIQYPAARAQGTFIIPHTVTSISKYAFLNAYRLTDILFYEGEYTPQVTIIGEGAFYGCNGISTIQLPESIANIGNRAFYSLGSMTSIRMTADEPSILGSEVFGNSPVNAIYVENATAENIYKSTSVSGWTIELKELIFNYNALTGGFLVTNGVLINYSGEGGDIVIPENVTSIAAEVFMNANITGVSGGANIVSVGENAFYGTQWLDKLTVTTVLGTVLIKHIDEKTVILDNSITEIYEDALADCDNVENITLPDNLISIGNNAFYSCDKLSTISIPATVTNIGISAFMDCGILTGVFMQPAIAPELGIWAFELSPVQAIYTGNAYVNTYKTVFTDYSDIIYSNTIIDANGFAISSESIVHYLGNGGDIILPAAGVTDINANAFTMNNNINSIYISSNITNIGDYAFDGAKILTSVEFNSSSAPTIGSFIFNEAPVIAIYVPLSSIENYQGITSQGWDSDKVYNINDQISDFLIIENVLVHYQGISAEVIIPDTVTGISSRAFLGRNTITSITIPAAVTSIAIDAFDYCNNIEEYIVLPENMAFSSDLGVLFNYDKTSLIKYPVGNNSVSYSIPASVLAIQSYAFYNVDNLTAISISNDVNALGQYSFFDCDGLTAVIIGGNVDIIESYSFGSCDNLSNLTFGDGVSDIRSRAFDNCKKLTAVIIPESVISIGAYAFNNNRSLSTVIIGSNIITIYDYAFFNCILIESVTVSATVVPSLGENAFKYIKNGYSIIEKLVIYVPETSLDNYKSDTEWSEYQAYIQSISK